MEDHKHADELGCQPRNSVEMTEGGMSHHTAKDTVRKEILWEQVKGMSRTGSKQDPNELGQPT